MGSKKKDERKLDRKAVSLRRRVAGLEGEIRSVEQEEGNAGEPGRSGPGRAEHTMLAPCARSTLHAEALLDAIAESVSVYDMQGRLLMANRVFLARYGLEAEQIVGKDLSELGVMDPQQLRWILEDLVPQVQRDGLIRDIEMVGTRRDGSNVAVSVNLSLLKDAAGEPVGVVVSAKDIGPQKNAERELKASEERYRTLVESAGEAISSVTEAGVFTFMNATAARRLGLAAQEAAGRTMWDCFPADIADRHMGAIRDVIHTGKGRNLTTVTRVHGQNRWYNTTIEPLRDGRGNVTAALVIARDIHEYKEAQERLEEYSQKMMRAEQLACLGVLSATLAHEMTQPLTVVRLAVQNAIHDLKKSGESSAALSELQEALLETDSLVTTIDRFRTFARRGSDRVVKKIALVDIADKIFRLLQEGARQAKVSLQARELKSLPMVAGYEKDLEQLFFALTQNAIQAAGARKDRHFCISGQMAGDYVELRFEDDCGGIGGKNLRHIFEPFFTTKNATQGTGLGLCIVQRVVNDARGEIQVQSRRGVGTTFFVTLPIHRE